MGNCLGDQYYRHYMSRKRAACAIPAPPDKCGLENGSTLTDSSLTSPQLLNRDNYHNGNNWAGCQNNSRSSQNIKNGHTTQLREIDSSKDYNNSSIKRKSSATISNTNSNTQNHIGVSASSQSQHTTNQVGLKSSSASSTTITTQNSNSLNIEHSQSISIIPPILQDGDPMIMVAIFDYHHRTDEELSLRKYDKVIVLNNIDSEWWLVEHQTTKARGYVPTPFLAPFGSIEAEDWFIRNINRNDSKRLLMLQGNPNGTFMVRQCESCPDAYSLSILDKDSEESVKHYKIRFQDQRYNITSRHTFERIQQLINFYSEGDHGLCCLLTISCPRTPPLTSDLSYKTKDHWEISRDSIELIERLGGGQFGDVYKGKWNDSVLVAVKTVKPGSMSKEDFLKEARLMKDLNHAKLVKLYAVCSEDPIFIITELMSHGSLLDYLLSESGKNLKLKILVDIIAQIASGMWYLEKKRYIHRDLAARNILVGENNVVKVADFGLARMIHDSETYEAKQGTKFPIKWTAPEAALMGRFTIKSDVWSFGIVVYEVITYGSMPYASMNNTQTLTQVDSGYRIPKPENCPQAMYNIMLETWNSQPDSRPTFEYLYEFFDDFFIRAETNYKKTEIT